MTLSKQSRYLLQRCRDDALEAMRAASAHAGAKYEGKPGRAPPGKGDFAFACHPLAKALRKSPVEIAGQLRASIDRVDHVVFEVEGGYLNGAVHPDALVTHGLREVLEAGEGFGTLAPTQERVIVEHTSANPNGPLHVGRARNPIIGDSVARLLRRSGNEVATEFFVNDIGKQLVTLAWGVNNLTEKDLQALPGRLEAAKVPTDEIEPLRGLAEQGMERGKADHELVRFYQAATALSKIDPAVEAAIVADVQAIERGDPGALKRVRDACERVLGGMKQSLTRLGAEFSRFTFESQFIVDGSVAKVVERLKSLPSAHAEGGAFYLDLTPFQIAGRSAKYFFVRADGTSLYSTRDVAYHIDKGSRCDRNVNVLGEDQKLAAKQVECALTLMESSFRPEALFYAFVSLPEGKMSTRRGRVVSIDDLLDEAVAQAAERVAENWPDLAPEARAPIAEAVGVGAVRYNIVRVQPEKSIVFKWEEALNFKGNSAPFLQYAHARACSILRKAKRDELIGSPQLAAAAVESIGPLSTDAAAVRLARTICWFPLIIEEAAEAVRPHYVATYAQELAAGFNEFYRDVPVIGSGEAEQPRLALVAAARCTLAASLEVLGISALREM